MKIIELIKQDLHGSLQKFELINAKNGVYVYKCLYNGISAVVKYFEKVNDRREILNYRILAEHNIPTLKTLELGKTAFVMENILVSEDWRLGVAEDLDDIVVAKSLACWYFSLHENGADVSGLNDLYFEYDLLTKENFEIIAKKFSEANELFEFLLINFDKLQDIIYKPAFTLTYNDFFWTNLVVRKDKSAAMMFDYNLLGKGYRYSDLRNVCWSMSETAKSAFMNEYNRLYFDKYGQTRTSAEKIERQIDEVAGDLFQLVLAFTEKENNPNWAVDEKEKVRNGKLLTKVKQLFT